MEMLPAGRYRFMPEGATVQKIPLPSDRPVFVNRFSFDCHPPATAVFLPPERLAARPSPVSPKAYLRFTPNPEAEYQARRYAYAYITPADAPCRDEPGPFVRLVFRTLALDLPQTFELQPPEHGADATVRFRTPQDREAAMRRQPFVLDGATVSLLREGETPNVRRVSLDYIVHAVLHEYPVDHLSREEIEDNCVWFGEVREIAPVISSEDPDLATVRVILQLEDPRELAHELRINYGDRSVSVVHVQIVRVWLSSDSYDVNGQYVRLFQAPVADA